MHHVYYTVCVVARVLVIDSSTTHDCNMQNVCYVQYMGLYPVCVVYGRPWALSIPAVILLNRPLHQYCDWCGAHRATCTLCIE